MSGLKNQVSWSNKSGSWLIEVHSGAKNHEDDSNSGSGCLAVVPWLIENLEGMDADDDDTEDTSMEVEEEDAGVHQLPNVSNGLSSSLSEEGLQQWQQHHCMIPQPPNSIETPPISWYR